MKTLVVAAVLLTASVANAQYYVMPGHGYTRPIPQTYYGYGYNGYANPGYNNYGTINTYRMGTMDFYQGTGAFGGFSGETYRFGRSGRYGYSQYRFGW